MKPTAAFVVFTCAPVLLAHGAPISRWQQEEQRNRAASDALLEREEAHAEKLCEHASQLADAEGSMHVQLERIQRKEHLAAAAARVEQAFERVEALRAAVAAINRDYAKMPAPLGAHKESRQDQLERKRDRLADLLDPKEGAIVQARDALSRLLCALENEREPDPQLALDAAGHMRKLADSVSRFTDSITQIHGCYSFVPLLAEIEREQRKITVLLNAR